MLEDVFMSKKLYSLDEAMQMLKVSRATLYNRSNLSDNHEKKIIFEETPEGRKFYLDSELESNLNKDSKKLDEIKEPKSKINENILMLEMLKEAHEKNLYYAEITGQVKLLTDNSKFYQDEYFRIKHELETLQNVNLSNVEQMNNLRLELEKSKLDNENLRLEHEKIKAENQQLKQKSFFGIKFNK